MNHMVPPHMLDALDRRIAMDRDKARQDRATRLLRVDMAARDISRSACLLVGSHLPEFYEPELHDRFRDMARLLGYTVTKGTEQ